MENMKKLDFILVVVGVLAVTIVFAAGLLYLGSLPEPEKEYLFEEGTVKGVYTDEENHLLQVDLENGYSEVVRVEEEIFLRYKEESKIRLTQAGVVSCCFTNEKGDLKIVIHNYLDYGWQVIKK